VTLRGGSSRAASWANLPVGELDAHRTCLAWFRMFRGYRLFSGGSASYWLHPRRAL